MKFKVKKQNSDGVVRLETSGSIREVLINEDFLHLKDASVAVCFRGKDSSGIVEFTPEEIEDLYKEIAPKLHLLKNVKLFKYKKD
ncbi:hypothetical protein KAJ87_03010 [Candidatus Pacearchaeota archaeon]|nr:hypothetical protein [Candidatus Pacearchaeota archaeon]